MSSAILIFFILIFLLVLVILGIRAIYVAFFKKKDERSKWIVIKSMADSFIVITILQTILLVIQWYDYSFYQQWWSNFKETLYIEPAILNAIILGVILIINTKKHGGSL